MMEDKNWDYFDNSISSFTPEEALSNAIIARAALDYERALRSKNNRKKKELESFFKSKLFKDYSLLLKVEGEDIIKLIKEKVENDSNS